MKMPKNEIIFAIIAISLGVLTRTFLDLGHNIEMITAFAIVSGFYFNNKKLAYAVPLISMVISDVIIGNTSIFLFTWSGFLFAPMLGFFLRNLADRAKDSKFAVGLVGSQIGGIVSTMLFFLWTNFGVWIEGTMYARTGTGLIQSYINAIPFLTNQFVGNIIIVPIVFAAAYFFFNYGALTNPIKKFSLKK